MATIVKVVPKTVELSLSGEEAEALLEVLDAVGGSPTESRRKYTDAVYLALLLEFPNYKKYDTDDGSVFFK